MELRRTPREGELRAAPLRDEREVIAARKRLASGRDGGARACELRAFESRRALPTSAFGKPLSAAIRRARSAPPSATAASIAPDWTQPETSEVDEAHAQHLRALHASILAMKRKAELRKQRETVAKTVGVEHTTRQDVHGREIEVRHRVARACRANQLARQARQHERLARASACAPSVSPPAAAPGHIEQLSAEVAGLRRLSAQTIHEGLRRSIEDVAEDKERELAALTGENRNV